MNKNGRKITTITIISINEIFFVSRKVTSVDMITMVMMYEYKFSTLQTHTCPSEFLLE